MGDMAVQFLAGGAAGVAVLVATHWIDTLKLLGQLGRIDWPAVRRNPLKLYAGITPAMVETAAYNGLQFGVYELTKALWIRQRRLSPTALIGDIANLIMGLISGCVTQSLTCPIKTVAIRISSGVTGEKTMGEAVSNVYKESGIGGFFAGNVTGLISQPGTIAFSFYFFERLRFLGNRFLPGAGQLVAFLGGGLAQSAAVVIMYPARAAKDKLQGQKEGTYSGLVDVLRKSYTAGGLFGNGGIYGGCIQDAVGNFAKKGLTFWSRDLFVAAFVQLLGRRPVK